MADRKILSRDSFNLIQPESSIRKKFEMTGAFGVDPYARKPVMKKDKQGRHYRDFEGYLYSEDDLADILDAYNDPNEGFQSMIRSMIKSGSGPKEAIAKARVIGQIPYVNYQYVKSDLKNSARDTRDMLQEDRYLAAAGSGAMGLLEGLDAAATYAPFAIGPAYRAIKSLPKSVMSAARRYQADRADVAIPPSGGFKRIEPPLTRRRGILEF